MGILYTCILSSGAVQIAKIHISLLTIHTTRISCRVLRVSLCICLVRFLP